MEQQMTEYKFTKDWFQWAPQVWLQFIPLLPERLAFLEIGSFEGRSMVWTAANMTEKNMRADIHCIDTWKGGEEHATEDMDSVERRFDHNMRVVTDNKLAYIHKYKGTSVQLLAHWLEEDPEDHPTFDFIYIDGSHKARDVLTDACMAWPLLKPEGIMVFDDYLWGNPRDALHRPKIAIDAFTSIFGEEMTIIYTGYQLAVRKNK